MKIEITDSLLEKYREVINRRMLSSDVGEYVETLIKSELQKLGEEGYTNDGLTGCKNRFQVARDFKLAFWEKGWNDTSVYHNHYLCIDIDKFYKYMDVHGLMAGDEVLKNLADQLRQDYSGKNIYRYGGDEFVVEMKDAVFQSIQLPGVEVKYSIIEIEINREQRSRYNFERFLDLFIEMGILQSSATGTMIQFRYPPETAG